MKTHPLLLTLTLLLPLNAPFTFATDTINIANPTPGNGYTFSNHILTITSSGSYLLTGSTSENRVIISPNIVATITLHNVSITSSTNSPFTLSPDGCTVALRIEGANTLTNSMTRDSAVHYAALQVEGTNTSLTIDGSGSLTVTGGVGGAGIGGGLVEGAAPSIVGTIHIKGGTLSVTGGYYSAAIGGGAEGNGGNITITGGNITATGGDGGTGIGGGYNGTSGNILISGGIIRATGGNQGTGIGGGGGGDNGNIAITGGVVMAVSGYGAAAIGERYGGSGAGNIQITGGNVFAYATPGGYGIGGAAIGNGDQGTSNAGSIQITGGTVVAGRLGIGGASNNVLTPVSISGGAILADTINLAATADIGNAQVQRGVSLPLEMLQALANNAFASATADTTLIVHEQHDTLPLPDTLIYDTIFNTDSLHDTIYMGTDSLHDTMYFDTDSVYDTIHVDVEVHDTLTDTTLIYDTLHVADTVWSEAEVFDTTLIPVSVYDTTHVPVNIIDTTFAPDTIILRDTVVIWNDIPIPLYIVVDPILGTQTIVTDDAPIIDAANGLLLTALTPSQPFAIYSIDGSLVVRTTATPAGTYRFTTLASGTYLLWHAGKWGKFVHK